jgi:hypothetical protein
MPLLSRGEGQFSLGDETHHGQSNQRSKKGHMHVSTRKHAKS